MLKVLLDSAKDQVEVITEFEKDTFKFHTKTFIMGELVNETSLDLEDLYEAFKERLHDEWYE